MRAFATSMPAIVGLAISFGGVQASRAEETGERALERRAPSGEPERLLERAPSRARARRARLEVRTQQTDAHYYYAEPRDHGVTLVLSGFDAPDYRGSVKLARQEPSAPVDATGLRGKELARAIQQAVRWRELPVAGWAPVRALGELAAAEPDAAARRTWFAAPRGYNEAEWAGYRAAKLASGTPVRASETTADGRERSAIALSEHVPSLSLSGEHDDDRLAWPSYRPWLTAANVFATPAFRGDHTGGVAELFAPAAFPIGARVTITNLGMRDAGMKGHTLARTIKGTTGSLKLVLPAPIAGAEFELAVETGRGDAARSVRYRFSLPEPGSAEVARHGIAFLPLRLRAVP